MSAYITREWCPCPSNFRCQMDLDAFLKQQNIPGIYDLDTRYLTKLIRERGVMNGRLTSLRPDSAAVEDLKGWAITDAVAHVTCREPYQIPSPLPRHHVVLWDFGAKQNIIRKLHALNCDLTIVPASTTAARILSYSPDGIMLSNGPGNPKDNPAIISDFRHLPGASASRPCKRCGHRKIEIRTPRCKPAGERSAHRQGLYHQSESRLCRQKRFPPG